MANSPSPRPLLQERISQVLGGKTSINFVQVGSNDGVKGDPIHKIILAHEHWRGLFIEPVSYLYQRLKENYGHAERFAFENVAIGSTTGRQKFYYVSEDAKNRADFDLPYWYDQLGSFDRDHILKHLDGKLEPYIIEEEVECVRFQEVLDRNAIKTIDLLHIDAEGSDYKVLSQVDLRRYRPSIILCEHKHLSAKEKEKMDTLLSTSGYHVSQIKRDTLAVLRT